MTVEVAAFAAAKINLALHVTGRRADGYHLIDSLVVFAEDLGDSLTVRAAERLSLSVDGPGAAGVPEGDDNLVLRGARALAGARGAAVGAAIFLEKHLPHGAGLGGGSADCAAALRALAALWDVPPLSADAALGLGADVPVCLAAPAPRRMSGIGEILTPVPNLPPLSLLLVHPGVAVPTGRVFAARTGDFGAGLDPLPILPDKWRHWLGDQRNDLRAAAEGIAPVIGDVTRALAEPDGYIVGNMSGSGSACWALYENGDAARAAARWLAARHPGWWVRAVRTVASRVDAA